MRQAAADRGYEARQRRIEGDSTQVVGCVDPATIVTLDKVICCYPDMVTLVRASARKTTALDGIVIPRDTAWVRAIVGLVNWFLQRVLRWQFRAFVRIGRSTVCVPKKGSTWIKMIPACSGACGSTGGPPPDG